MPRIFRVLGKVAGRAMKTQAVDHAISVAASYVMSEMRLTDLRAKRALLIRKRDSHLTMLGRNALRQVNNDVEPTETAQFRQLVDVIREIDSEIDMVTAELARRREEEHRRRSQHNRKSGQADGQGNHQDSTRNPGKQ